MEIDVATRELIKLMLLPPGILILMLLIGWLMARRFFGRFVILLAIVLFYGLSTPMGVNWLASQLETIPPLTPTQLKASRADAIWVLMAGINRHNPELGGGDRLSWHSLERIDHALALHRKTGLPIIPSGGSVRGDTRPVAQLGSEWLQSRAAVKTLAVESASRDTWETHSSARRCSSNRASTGCCWLPMPSICRGPYSARGRPVSMSCRRRSPTSTHPQQCGYRGATPIGCRRPAIWDAAT